MREKWEINFCQFQLTSIQSFRIKLKYCLLFVSVSFNGHAQLHISPFLLPDLLRKDRNF